MTKSSYDLVIVGAGPIGVDAGIRAFQRDLDVVILEKEQVGNHLLEWNGVEMFTPFEMNRSAAALEYAENYDLEAPESGAYLSGSEYVGEWLEPLVTETPLSSRLESDTEVRSITRRGLLKGDRIGCDRRADPPFRLIVDNGDDRVLQAESVIDASGTFGQPNPLGTGGVPAPGERDLNDRIERRFPTQERLESLEGDRILLVGGGFSAATNLVALHSLGDDSATEVNWLVRRSEPPPLTPMEDDPLEKRDELRSKANRLAETGDVNVIQGPGIDRLEETDDAVEVTLTDRRVVHVDFILSNVGYRPDRSLYRELQFHECYGTEGPIDLSATLLSQDGADCLDVEAGGADVLENPEPNFFVLGSKSYGRQSNFLLETGFDQVNDLFNEFF